MLLRAFQHRHFDVLQLFPGVAVLHVGDSDAQAMRVIV